MCLLIYIYIFFFEQENFSLKKMKRETNAQMIQTPKGAKGNKQQRKTKIPTTITNEKLKRLSKEQIH